MPISHCYGENLNRSRMWKHLVYSWHMVDPQGVVAILTLLFIVCCLPDFVTELKGTAPYLSSSQAV